MEKYIKVHPYYASVAIVLLFSIGYLSLTPLTGVPKPEFDHTDKIIHFLMYFILSLVLAKAFFKIENLNHFEKAFPVFLSFFYSFSIEILQELLTNSRFFDIFDILANGIGCLVALAVINTQFFNKKTII